MVAFNVLTKPLRRTWLNQDVFIPFNQCGKDKRKVVAFVRCFSDSEHILKSGHPPVELPQVPLHEYVFENLHRWENKIALECGVTGKKVTYKDFYNSSKNLARSLQKKLKLKKGDHQFVLLPNCPEYPSVFMAGSMTGVVTTTANPLYTPYEISKQLGMTQSKVIFTTLEFYGKCVEALDKLRIQIPIVFLKLSPSDSIPQGAIDFSELTSSSTPDTLDPVHVDLNSNVVLPFSSGTSGLPKGVELSHKNITANLIQITCGSYLRSKPDKESNQVISVAILPMFHIYGMTALSFYSLTSGDRLITLPKFEPKLFVETIYTKKASVLFLVPPLVFFLAHHPLVEEQHLRNVYCVVSGAAPAGAVDSAALKKKSPQIMMCQGYGMTETSPVVTLTHVDRIHKSESVGHPISLTQIKIADPETGKALPRGTRGEICVKGPQVMKGYFNQPQATKDVFDSDGWLKTGDAGYYDEENDLYVKDRIKELIKMKGFQVAPAEIEETLRDHPKIYDAGVVGVPHAVMGEVPKAFIAVKPGQTLTEEEVMDFVKERLSPYKQLKGGVTIVDSIPRNSAGKILRRALAQLNKKSD